MKQLRGRIDIIKERFSEDYNKIITNPTPDWEYDARRTQKLYEKMDKDIDKILYKIIEIDTGKKPGKKLFTTLSGNTGLLSYPKGQARQTGGLLNYAA